MQDFIAQFGDYAPLIFLLLASILPIFLFPPGMFLISRYFARDYIEKFLVRKLSLKEFNRIFGIKENKLTVFLIIFRLIPILPNSVVSYSYGLTRISFKNYFIANLIGLIPGRLIWLNFGSTLNNIWSLEFLHALLLVLLFIGIGFFVTKRID